MFESIIEHFVKFIELTVHSYWGAFFWMLCGFVLAVISFRDRKTRGMGYLRGWAGAIGLILLGVLIIIFKIMGEL